MIIIYNLAGLLVGGVGVGLGLAVFVLATIVGLSPANALAAGTFAIAGVWLVGGVAWRNQRTSAGEQFAWPSLFFIPLPFAAAPVAGLAVFWFLIGLIAGRTPADPRANLLRADEKELSAFAATGDVELSNRLLTALDDATAREANADKYHIFTRVSDRGILVLIKAPNLKNYSNEAREQLLEMAADAVQAEPTLVSKPLFIGVKGRVLFGAMQYPPDVVETDSSVSETPLYDFYGEKPSATVEDGNAKLKQ
jgi:hypothetical protein